MRVVEEDEATRRALARVTGFGFDYVTEVMGDVHYIIDSFVAHDWNVLMGPLYFIRGGNPVVPAMDRHLTREDWRARDGLKTAAAPVLAAALKLPVEVVEAHPTAFGIHVLDTLADWRSVRVEDRDEYQRLDDLLWAWRKHMDEHGVRYQVSTAGRERDFEEWLLAHPEKLAAAGIHVEVVSARPPLAGGSRRADLLCRLTAPMGDLRIGDLLVIENKTTPVGIDAMRQLDEYVTLVAEELASETQGVGGLLIADGRGVELQKALTARGFLYESLVSLGYRQHLYRTCGLATKADISRGADMSLTEPVEADLPDRPG